MRCNNCGWDNPASATKCDKCSTPIRGAAAPQNNDQYSERQPIHGTVKGADPDLPYLDEPSYQRPQQKKQQENVQANEYPCPECGYPVTKGMVKCPECKQVLGAQQKREYQEPQANQQKKPFTGTVNPWAQAKYSKCSFKPVPRENEKPLQSIELSGDEITLNRSNLEPENKTITSKEQAVLVNQDGKWYLVDKSSLKTTFKLISEPIEIKKGDIILMGDRKFEFDC